MIIVTGGAGFIGSALVWALNKKGREDIIVVDQFGVNEMFKNLISLKYLDVFDKDDDVLILIDLDEWMKCIQGGGG